MWTSSSYLVQPYQTGPLFCVIRPWDHLQNLNLLHFDQIISLKSLSINLFLLARLNLGLQLMRRRVQASQKALCSEKERERERETDTEREKERERERRLFKQCQNLSARHCAAGVQLFKWCCKLSACTVLQGCSCLSNVATSGVETFLPALCGRGAAV